MTITHWINGAPAQSLTLTDRGLHYGDGVFETLAVHQARPLLLDAHLERLQMGCDRLCFESVPDLQDVRRQAEEAAKQVEQGVMKIIVTRGTGNRGYRPPAGSSPACILGLYPWPEFPDSHTRKGVSVRICDSRLGHQPRLAGIKHLNRLEQIVARAEWADEHAEGLMLDQEGTVVAGTMSNIFMVAAGAVVTPLVDRCGIRGVVRAEILRLARDLGLAAHECRIRLEDLLQAEEAFVTNSLIGIWPINRIAHRRFLVGAVTRQLQDRIRDGHVAIVA